jgi:hypothetical protein
MANLKSRVYSSLKAFSSAHNIINQIKLQLEYQSYFMVDFIFWLSIIQCSCYIIFDLYTIVWLKYHFSVLLYYI